MYNIDANWNGNPAIMPGLSGGGEIYVLEAQPPANATGIQISNADGSTLRSGSRSSTPPGRAPATSVHYTVIMPGAVLDHGDLPVNNGQFDYYFSPTVMNSRAQTYDIVDRTTGKPAIGDVIHLSFFSAEKTPDGQTYHSMARAILRGTQIRIAR